MQTTVPDGKFTCPFCNEKTEKIKKLVRILIRIENAFDNCQPHLMEKLVEQAKELTEDEDV